jgi:hypothetical protein
MLSQVAVFDRSGDECNVGSGITVAVVKSVTRTHSGLALDRRGCFPQGCVVALVDQNEVKFVTELL